MDVYRQIKKQNGEAFAKTIRDFHDGIFEIPNIVDIVKYAGHDAKPLLRYLYSLCAIETQDQPIYEDPITLLKKEHYNAYYVTNLEEQNAIQKYFPEKDALCIFTDPERHKENYIINCVKENAEEIKKKEIPQREDEYGLSVLSIQVSKKDHTVSIISRYNHNVPCPNNTYDGNLDNIAMGLSAAVQHHFNINFNGNQFSILPRGYTLVCNRIIRYKTEVNTVYVGSDFYVKDGMIVSLNKDSQIMIEDCILDLKNRKITDLANSRDFYIDTENVEDKSSLAYILANELKGKKISVRKDKGVHHIFADNTFIATLQEQSILNLNLPTTKEIGDLVLSDCQELRAFTAPKLEKVGRYFLHHNRDLEKLALPSLKEVGDFFLSDNERLNSIYMPNLERVGDNFLLYNNSLEYAEFPKLKSAKSGFFCYNRVLRELKLPLLETVEDLFLQYNLALKELYLPNLRQMGYGCLLCNEVLETFYAPKLNKVKHDFYYSYAAHLMKQKQRE